MISNNKDSDDEADFEEGYDDPNDPYNQLINFESIRTTDGLETAISVQWKDQEHTKLLLSTLLEQDEIAPLFAGAQWAGTRVWHAAIAMVQYIVDEGLLLQPTSCDDAAPRRLLELGCGLGVPGMLCHALYGTETYLTDQASILSQLIHNIAHNFDNTAKIHAHALSWSPEADLPPNLDVVINCDCIYEPLYGKSWMLLANVLDSVLEKNPHALVLTSVERRTADGVDKFLHQLCQHQLSPHVDRTELVWTDTDCKIEIYRTYGVVE